MDLLRHPAVEGGGVVVVPVAKFKLKKYLPCRERIYIYIYISHQKGRVAEVFQIFFHQTFFWDIFQWLMEGTIFFLGMPTKIYPEIILGDVISSETTTGLCYLWWGIHEQPRSAIFPGLDHQPDQRWWLPTLSLKHGLDDIPHKAPEIFLWINFQPPSRSITSPSMYPQCHGNVVWCCRFVGWIGDVFSRIFFEIKYLALTGDFPKWKGYVSNWFSPHKKNVDSRWDELLDRRDFLRFLRFSDQNSDTQRNIPHEN